MSTFVEKIRAMREQGRIEENPRDLSYKIGIPPTPVVNIQSKDFSVSFQKDPMGRQINMQQHKIPSNSLKTEIGYLSLSKSHIPPTTQRFIPQNQSVGRGDRPHPVPMTLIVRETPYSSHTAWQNHYPQAKLTELPNFSVSFG